MNDFRRIERLVPIHSRFLMPDCDFYKGKMFKSFTLTTSFLFDIKNSYKMTLMIVALMEFLV